MSQNVLRLDNITMQFGGVVAVDNLSLEVNEGEIVALIGPNGAGKTTAFNTITGVYEPTNGQVSFMGEPIVRNHPQGKMKQNYKGKEAGKFVQLPVLDPTPDRITKLGMARTFQNIRLWKSQTVFDNVLIAKHMLRTSNVFSATFRLNRKEEAQHREEVMELLRIVGLEDVKDELATSLPYGKQRPRAGDASEAPDARRACCRHEPAGDERADRVHRPHPRRVPHDHSAHRAPHGPRHGHFRPHLRH